jgi:exodeoxyribonuclease V gamma subunit
MMGMNFREFPRIAKAPSFDKLIQGEKKLLDPNPRISDQSTFLEALFAAKEAFYISYIGKSDQDNATIPASTVVEELIGLVASTSDSKEEDFVISHPLHSFSVKYNQDNDTKLKNYLIQKEEGEEFKSVSESNGLELKEVHLSQLKSFFKDPFKYYYNQVLGIYYSDQRHQLDNRERFDSDGLNDWLIKDRLLRSPDFSSKLHRKELLAEGLLPLRNVGVAILDRLGIEIEELHAAYTKLLPVETRQLTLQLEGITLNGQLNFGSDSRLLFVTPSKTEKKRKYLIEVALDYLFGVATGAGNDLHVLSLDKKDFWSQKIGQQEAKEKLTELTKIFITHLDRRFVYTPDINLDKILNEPSPNSLQEARVQVIKECRSEYSSISEYIKREESIGFFEEDTSIQSLLTTSRIMSEIFKPFF